MITSIGLENFKCFSATDLSCSPLTLLAGLNGSGKSSVIQSLILLRQAFIQGRLQEGYISAAGELLDLGSMYEVLHENAVEEIIGITIKESAHVNHVKFRFHVVRGSEAYAVSVNEMINGLGALLGKEDCAVLFRQPPHDKVTIPYFHYLNAERNGPRKFLPIGFAKSEIIEIGAHGEFVLQFLDAWQDKIVLAESDARLVSGNSYRLRDQLSIWLEEISPGVQLSLKSVPDADLMIGGFSFGEAGMVRSRDYRATNVAFGLSYVLPVITALLATPAGGLVLIENPEAHMHPRGQTKLGELCARAAAAGVQVVIETHSDHVMDGVRIAIREKLLASTDAVFHYFKRAAGKSEILTPRIDAEGRLSEWPDGFFDQHRRNSARLIKPRNGLV